MEVKLLFRLLPVLILPQLIESLGDVVRGPRPAKRYEIPYIVGILPGNGSHGYCGGAILQPKLIISAAHCFVDGNGHRVPAASLSVVAGVLRWSEDGGQVTGVKKIKIHKDYNPKTFENNIAILELLLPLQLGKAVEAIQVSRGGGNQGPEVATISGWGKMRTKPYCQGTTAMSPVLQKADVLFVPRSKCDKLRQQEISPFHIYLCPHSAGGHSLGGSQTCILATHWRTDTCIGENGGLLVCSQRANGEVVNYLCGIGSTGCGCGEGRPGCFTDVTYLHDWIAENSDVLD